MPAKEMIDWTTGSKMVEYLDAFIFIRACSCLDF